MRNTAKIRSDSLEDQIGAVRARVLATVWNGLLIIALIGVPFSISRSMFTGWMPLYSVHLLLGCLVVILYSFSNRFSVFASASIIMALMWAVGVMGVFVLGPLGAGLWWMVCAALLAGVLVSPRAGWLSICGATAIVIAAGIAFVNGWIELSIDANEFVRQPQTWATLLIAAAVLPLFVFQSISELTGSIQKLAAEIAHDKGLVEEIAFYDELTGLPTRRLFSDRLGQAIKASERPGTKVAVMFIDLDGFKNVNDRYGHEAGDFALVSIAGRCNERLRASDTIARTGGDEFLVILSGIDGADYAEQVANELVDIISKPLEFGGQVIKVGASIGIALYPDHGSERDELIQKADAAMYQAKRDNQAVVRLSR